MRAVVLVGGLGTRLRPLTLTTPKQLLPVAGRTMIERVVGHLVQHGVDEVILSMGYLPDAFEAAFPQDRCAGAHLVYAVEPHPLDTAGAVRFAAEFNGVSDTFLVVNGDVLTDLDITTLIRFHKGRGAEGTVALARVSDPSAFGVVLTDEQGRVKAFVEKPKPGEAPTNLINAGTYVLEPSVLDRIPAGRPVSIERETFPAMVDQQTLYALASDAYWIDAGTPQKYLLANLDLVASSGPPAPGAVDTGGGVWVLGSPRIRGAVRGPSLICNAALLEGDAVVERSVVGVAAQVMSGAHVRRSVLLTGAVVRPGAVVEDSIVGEGAVVGGGATVRSHSVVGGGVELAAGRCVEAARVPA